MANKLRDRDGILSKEGIIFRVYGYSHPPVGYICDVEYAPSNIYKSKNMRVLRKGTNRVFYKFFEDKGLKFVEKNYPQYKIFYHPIQRYLIGVKSEAINSTRIPVKALQKVLEKEANDKLLKTLKEILRIICSISSLKTLDFGVFGSILHKFYHPEFSDIDLVLIGKRNLVELRELLSSIYKEGNTLINEYSSTQTWSKGSWKFTNYSLREYEWHQKRKLIYGLYVGTAANRRIKIEFEPVRDYSEVINEYDKKTRIKHLGWVECYGRIVDCEEGGFIPSTYKCEIYDSSNPQAIEACRILSYLEEFRLQVEKGEKCFIAGNLEEVTSSNKHFYQITLSYGSRYYDQTLKSIEG